MKLPNGENADLGTKLEDYSLNPFHRHGQHKARVFEAALGITLTNKKFYRKPCLWQQKNPIIQLLLATMVLAKLTFCVFNSLPKKVQRLF